jgi:hypothetical protein
VLIAHLDKYPLITKKYRDYVIFKSVVELISKKEHLNEAGLQKIVEYKASLNRGLSPQLEAAFPGVTSKSSLETKLEVNEQIQDPN